MTAMELARMLNQVDPKFVRKTDVFTKTGPTWRVIMKTSVKIAVTAAAVVLVAGFLFVAWYLQTYYGVAPGSTGEQEPLRILVDLEQRASVESDTRQEMMDNFMALLNYELPEEEKIQYELEFLPVEQGDDREAAIQRLRVEIMAGKGPDVYLISTPRLELTMVDDDEKPNTLFRFPETAMANGVFLPLDEYMEKAEFAEFDKFTQPVLEAGRNEQGQMILPMSYTLPLTIYRKSEVQPPEGPLTWTQQAESADPAWRLAAYWSGISGGANSIRMGSVFGTMANYDSGTLLLEEETLSETLKGMAKTIWKRWSRQEDLSGIPDYYQCQLNPNYSQVFPFSDHNGTVESFSQSESVTMFPVYNSEGGVTATVTCWAAVNANTKQPEKAFKVLDYFFSLRMQQANTSGKAQMLWRIACEVDAFPIHEDICMAGVPFGISHTMYTAENYQELCRLRSTITSAKFNSPLDEELESAFVNMTFQDTTEEEIEARIDEILPDLYDKMKKMVAES